MKDKKSVLLYCDIIHTIEKLDDDQAGKLFKHYLRYINDQNPECDQLTEIIFEPIKQNLKRDLLKWGETKAGRSKAGKISAAKRKERKEQELTNSTSVESVEQNSTNPTVNDNVTVNVNDNVIYLEKHHLDSDTRWIIALGNSYDIPTPDVEDLLNDWWKQFIGVAIQHSEQEIIDKKTHFNRWLKIQVKKVNPKTETAEETHARKMKDAQSF